jgi:aminoglycoside 6'-N-acetyltransferase I
MRCGAISRALDAPGKQRREQNIARIGSDLPRNQHRHHKRGIVTGHHVREAWPRELSTLLDLAAAFYVEEGFTTPVWQLRENILVLLDSDSARVAVACGHNDEIVGFAITTLTFGLEYGRLAELEDLFVVPAHRRTGVGRALIDDSADWARSRGCRALELVVAPNGANVDHLFNYYAHQGFMNEGRQILSRDLTL